MNTSALIAQFQPYGKHTPIFSLKGLQTYARVVSIHDGDTLTAVFPFCEKYYKFTIRLMGIDTCEMKSKNAQIKELADKARDRLVSLITGKSRYDFENQVCIVQLSCHEFDKYGRLLCDIFSTMQPYTSVADVLLIEKLAYVYNGDSRLSEEEQLIALT
jgi:endonuclease YncB( thermonuclease family)